MEHKLRKNMMTKKSAELAFIPGSDLTIHIMSAGSIFKVFCAVMSDI